MVSARIIYTSRRAVRRRPKPSPITRRGAKAEDLCGLLRRVLDEVEDLHPELREAIERALR